MPWPAFWVDPTDRQVASLRRFVFTSSRPEDPCPGGYHDASVPIGEIPVRRTDEGFLDAVPTVEYETDDRWPVRCAHCPYVFHEDDHWQVSTDLVYRRPDTGAEFVARSMPPGAMLDGIWLPQKGPDGIALVVVLPPPAADTSGHWWHVDGPARSGGNVTKEKAWTRTGDPKAVPAVVDVNPSIATDGYHGYLRNGVLTDHLG